MKQKIEAKYMRLAIEEGRKNLKKMDGGPFGACIVKNHRVLAAARNTVLRMDPTCHAEMNAIRIASRKLKTFDLSGCVIYSTTEPCPMCFSAINWARIGTIVYGSRIADAKRRGFKELGISNARMKAMGKSKVGIVSDFISDECYRLWEEWDKLKNKIVY